MDELLGLIGKNSFLVVNIRACFVNRKADGVVLATRNDITWILRIELSEEGDRYVDILGNLLEVLSLVGVDGVSNWILDIVVRADTVYLCIVHGIASCDIDREVSSSLFWEERIDAPEVTFTSSPVDSFVDVAWSAVVCSDDEVAILEDGV